MLIQISCTSSLPASSRKMCLRYILKLLCLEKKEPPQCADCTLYSAYLRNTTLIKIDGARIMNEFHCADDRTRQRIADGLSYRYYQHLFGRVTFTLTQIRLGLCLVDKRELECFQKEIEKYLSFDIRLIDYTKPSSFDVVDYN